MIALATVMAMPVSDCPLVDTSEMPEVIRRLFVKDISL
jgi:hypothetical protein